MRLATFQKNDREHAAIVLLDGAIVPVQELVADAPDDVVTIIERGGALVDALRAAAADPSSAAKAIASEGARLLAPIPRPRRNVMCVGFNYQRHFDEAAGVRGSQAPKQIPAWVTFFSKNPNTVVGTGAPVLHSAPYSDQIDWEVELAVIIGKRGRDIDEASAMDHVFGYTVANDISVRDIQRRHGGQFFKGKNFDTHMPLGPWIVTADEIPEPHSLKLMTKVNGVLKQDSSTRYMVFRIPRIVSELSAGMALQPGDIISTGSPEGSGIAQTPPQYLCPGDVVELEIEGIGSLSNPIVAVGS